MLLVNQLEIVKALGKVRKMDSGEVMGSYRPIGGHSNLPGRTCITLVLSGMLGVGWNVFSMIYSIKTLSRCSGSAGFSALRGVTILTIISNGLGGLGGEVAGMMGATGDAWQWAAGLVNTGCCLVAMILLYTESMVLFFTFGKDAGILEELMKNADKVRLEMTLAAILPSGIVFLAWVIAAGCWGNRRGAGWVTMLTIILMAIVGIISIVMSGFGNLLLGKIMGDPPGSLALNSKLGTTYVVLTSILPFLEGALVYIGFEDS